MNLQQTISELTRQRGVIPELPLTQLNYKFFDKLQEELNELIRAYHETGYIEKYELADCFIVICNCATANHINIADVALEKATRDVSRKKQ